MAGRSVQIEVERMAVTVGERLSEDLMLPGDKRGVKTSASKANTEIAPQVGRMASDDDAPAVTDLTERPWAETSIEEIVIGRKIGDAQCEDIRKELCGKGGDAARLDSVACRGLAWRRRHGEDRPSERWPLLKGAKVIDWPSTCEGEVAPQCRSYAFVVDLRVADTELEHGE